MNGLNGLNGRADERTSGRPLVHSSNPPLARRPDWLKVSAPGGENYHELRQLMRGLTLHTVCEEARCPNLGDCWERRTATFMILGDTCTRSCGFCAVKTGRPDGALDWDEPRRVAEAVEQLGLKHAVITSVNRDERQDGGAPIFAATINAIRERLPECKVEVLIPDFKGHWDALATVLAAQPDVLNHNVETVPRCYPWVRPQAKYERSLELLSRAKQLAPAIPSKSGLMLGVGETLDEVEQTLRDLRAVDCEVVTLGQYLRPSLRHIAVSRYYEPSVFDDLRDFGRRLGFRHVEAGPLVRSSYHAREQTASL